MKNILLYDEEQLVLKLREKNSEAIGDLYDQYSPLLYGVIKKIIHDDDKAGNVLRKTFSAISNKIEFYNSSECSLVTWLLNLARGLALEESRLEKLQHANIRITDTLLIIEDLSLLMNDLNGHQPNDVLDNMEPRQRTLLDLIYFQGYNAPETAKLLGISEILIKPKLRAAMLNRTRTAQKV
ncbi:MAG: sigma-70 family RNA polymerase sigma factor [Bacteroidota bacterium]|nr:sigma-70 family RNA polymerase sigma factor [Bacteroidota bacterium]